MDGSFMITLKTSIRVYPILSLAVLTVIGIIISIMIRKDTFGPDQAIAVIFWIMMSYLWVKVLNAPVRISIKDNRIFFVDSLSNINYMLIQDILFFEKKKSFVTAVSKSKKVKFDLSFEGLKEFFAELTKINPEIQIKGFEQ
jgi:hypothetical protein